VAFGHAPTHFLRPLIHAALLMPGQRPNIGPKTYHMLTSFFARPSWLANCPNTEKLLYLAKIEAQVVSTHSQSRPKFLYALCGSICYCVHSPSGKVWVLKQTPQFVRSICPQLNQTHCAKTQFYLPVRIVITRITELLPSKLVFMQHPAV
jgi:hypothetical protein